MSALTTSTTSTARKGKKRKGTGKRAKRGGVPAMRSSRRRNLPIQPLRTLDQQFKRKIKQSDVQYEYKMRDFDYVQSASTPDGVISFTFPETRPVMIVIPDKSNTNTITTLSPSGPFMRRSKKSYYKKKVHRINLRQDGRRLSISEHRGGYWVMVTKWQGRVQVLSESNTEGRATSDGQLRKTFAEIWQDASGITFDEVFDAGVENCQYGLLMMIRTDKIGFDCKNPHDQAWSITFYGRIKLGNSGADEEGILMTDDKMREMVRNSDNVHAPYALSSVIWDQTRPDQKKAKGLSKYLTNVLRYGFERGEWNRMQKYSDTVLANYIQNPEVFPGEAFITCAYAEDRMTLLEMPTVYMGRPRLWRRSLTSWNTNEALIYTRLIGYLVRFRGAQLPILGLDMIKGNQANRQRILAVVDSNREHTGSLEANRNLLKFGKVTIPAQAVPTTGSIAINLRLMQEPENIRLALVSIVPNRRTAAAVYVMTMFTERAKKISTILAYYIRSRIARRPFKSTRAEELFPRVGKYLMSVDAVNRSLDAGFTYPVIHSASQILAAIRADAMDAAQFKWASVVNIMRMMRKFLPRPTSDDARGMNIIPNLPASLIYAIPENEIFVMDVATRPSVYQRSQDLNRHFVEEVEAENEIAISNDQTRLEQLQLEAEIMETLGDTVTESIEIEMGTLPTPIPISETVTPITTTTTTVVPEPIIPSPIEAPAPLDVIPIVLVPPNETVVEATTTVERTPPFVATMESEQGMIQRQRGIPTQKYTPSAFKWGDIDDDDDDIFTGPMPDNL